MLKAFNFFVVKKQFNIIHVKNIYLGNLPTHTVNNLLQTLNYVKSIQFFVVKQQFNIIQCDILSQTRRQCVTSLFIDGQVNIHLGNLLTHTVNNLLQTLNYVKSIQCFVVKQQFNIIHVMNIYLGNLLTQFTTNA